MVAVDGGALVLILDELAHLYKDIEISIPRMTYPEAVGYMYSFDKVANDKYWINKLQGESTASLEWRRIDQSTSGAETEPFPDLSGLRSHAKSGKNGVVTAMSALQWDEITDAARASETSPLAIFQAAWALLLVSYLSVPKRWRGLT
jgi:hypothetical protein